METVTYSNGDVEHRICYPQRVFIKLDAVANSVPTTPVR
jgi:hypothetical protein